MSKTLVEELKKHGMYVSTPKGVSMNPMLVQNESAFEIRSLTRTPARYDVVIYMRDNGTNVLHRVLGRQGEYFVINGDNCWQREYVRPEQIEGILTRFYRRGRWHSVTERSYRVYAHLVADFFFIRRPILYLRDRLKRVGRRLKRTLTQ